MDEKFILDATAGFRGMWLNKKHPNCLYVDERAEVKPDVIADFRNLSFIPNESKRLIVFDPPHMIQNTKTGDLAKRFGTLCPETWQSDLRKGFTELWRILAPYGVLFFKWSEHDKPLGSILKLFCVAPLVIQRSAGAKARNGRPSSTLWCCFMKIPSVDIESATGG